MRGVKVLYWNRTLTVYRKFDEGGRVKWHRSVVNRSFFQAKNTLSIGGNDEENRREYIARIPFGSVSEKIKTGDIIVLGESKDEINPLEKGKRAGDLLDRYTGEAFIVTGVHCNRIGTVPHILARG